MERVLDVMFAPFLLFWACSGGNGNYKTLKRVYIFRHVEKFYLDYINL